MKREAQDGPNWYKMAIIRGGVVHANSWWGYGVDVACGFGRLGLGVAQLGDIGGVVGGNCKLLLLHVVLGDERCA